MKFLYTLALIVFCHGLVSSQIVNQVGGSLGYSNYMGDLVVPTFTFKQSSIAANAFCKKQLNPFFSLRPSLLVGAFSGDDDFYSRNRNRGNRFKTTFFEMTFIMEYDLLGERRYPRNEMMRRILSPYIFTGIGFTVLSQSIHYGSADNPDISASYSAVQPAVPIGFGLKKDINKHIQIAMEWGMRLTFTDYLDGVKLSGDPSDNDVYLYGGLGVIYRLANYVR
ncbi:MAG: DUF6089 family protein [Bacteroidota bacterium]